MSNNIQQSGIKLTWDKVVKQFENLIKYAARQQVENHSTDTMISAEDLYQEGMIKLYDCWVKWCVNPDNNKDMDEFGPIFRKSLFRVVKKNSPKVKLDSNGEVISEPSVQLINLEDALMENMASGVTVESVLESKYIEHGLSHLRDMLTSETAKNLLSELIEPSPQTLYEVWADCKRKEMLKSQGKRVNVPKDSTVRMKHIQRALGITIKQYDIAMSEIREKARLTIDLAF